MPTNNHTHLLIAVHCSALHHSHLAPHGLGSQDQVEQQQRQTPFKVWVAIAQALGRKPLAQSASAFALKSRGKGGPIPGNAFLVSRLHCCANTSKSISDKALLTAQASSLSETSWSRHPLLGTSCTKPLAPCTLLCNKKWILQYRAVLFTTEVDQQKASLPMSSAYRSSAESRLCFQPWFAHRLHRLATKSCSAVVTPHTKTCAGLFATLGRSDQLM